MGIIAHTPPRIVSFVESVLKECRKVSPGPVVVRFAVCLYIVLCAVSCARDRAGIPVPSLRRCSFTNFSTRKREHRVAFVTKFSNS